MEVTRAQRRRAEKADKRMEDTFRAAQRRDELGIEPYEGVGRWRIERDDTNPRSIRDTLRATR